MTSIPTAPSRVSPATALGAVAALAALGWIGFAQWRLGRQVDALAAANAKHDDVLQQILGEVTRQRLEQSAGTKGPAALLEKLRVYAPLLSNSRVTEPDFQNARKEMAAILRAFGTIGTDAKKPIEDRLAQLEPGKDHDEIKWLIEALCEIDAPVGLKLLQEVLLGHRLPSPRLRWYAAEQLTKRDKPLAQQLLRRVLLTESARGFNPEYARAYPGAVIPDAAALSANGFSTYVVHYARTDDPKTEETLLMVLGRAEHDASTVRECVKVLGARKATGAVAAIEKVALNPPLQVDDPILINTCLDALVQIQGNGARPFLEQMLAKTSNPIVANKIQALLNELR
jgi:hypothetical protein